MFNNLKCPKLNFFLSDLSKLGKDDKFFCFITAPLPLEALGGKIYTAGVEKIDKKRMSQDGQGLDN